MENVPGILSSVVNGESVFSKVLKDLSNPTGLNKKDSLKYNLFPLSENDDDLFTKDNDFRINCESYGVPQSRKRVIILGIRGDLSPDQTPKLEPSLGISLEQVLMGLPSLRSGLSNRNNKKVTDTEDSWKTAVTAWEEDLLEILSPEIKNHLTYLFKTIFKKNYLNGRGGEFLKKDKIRNKKELHPILSDWIVDDQLDYHLNSESRSHMVGDLRRYIFNSAFAEIKGKAPLLKDYPEKLLPNHKSRKSGYQDRFRTLLGNKPSSTVTSHISKDGHAFIHPDPCQCRSLTVREAARIQSFPDNYFFCGNKSQQYTQVGNAVPPFLAYQISSIVDKILNK